jgi:hypothetical protein
VVGTRNAPTSTSTYSTAPARIRPWLGASSAAPASETASIGQKALATKRSGPPSGNRSTSAAPPTSAGIPSHAAAASSRRPPPATRASAASSTYAPATGLDQTAHSEARPEIGPQPRRRPIRSAASQAATAKPMPSVNGIRPMTTLASTPAANSQVAIAARTGSPGAAARASGANAAVAATAATTPTSAGPIHAAAGAYSSE